MPSRLGVSQLHVCPPRNSHLPRFRVHEIKPQTIGMGIHALIDAGSIVAAEIALYVAGDIVAVKLSCTLS